MKGTDSWRVPPKQHQPRSRPCRGVSLAARQQQPPRPQPRSPRPLPRLPIAQPPPRRLPLPNLARTSYARGWRSWSAPTRRSAPKAERPTAPQRWLPRASPSWRTRWRGSKNQRRHHDHRQQHPRLPNAVRSRPRRFAASGSAAASIRVMSCLRALRSKRLPHWTRKRQRRWRIWKSILKQSERMVFRRRSSPRLDLAWRTAFRLGFPFARLWWRLSHPDHEGALVAVYVGPDLLLVRSSYRTEWNLPGGSVRSVETPKAAARRELAEEIGFAASALVQAGVIGGIWDGRH